MSDDSEVCGAEWGQLGGKVGPRVDGVRREPAFSVTQPPARAGVRHRGVASPTCEVFACPPGYEGCSDDKNLVKSAIVRTTTATSSQRARARSAVGVRSVDTSGRRASEETPTDLVALEAGYHFVTPVAFRVPRGVGLRPRGVMASTG